MNKNEKDNYNQMVGDMLDSIYEEVCEEDPVFAGLFLEFLPNSEMLKLVMRHLEKKEEYEKCALLLPFLNLAIIKREKGEDVSKTYGLKYDLLFRK